MVGLGGLSALVFGNIGPVIGVLIFVVVGAFWTTVFTQAAYNKARPW